jgi:murein DD-endopeptidase MepM/ murein hydrolase activator NlpD
MAGRHGRTVAKSRRSGRPIRKLFASAGAMMVAVALAATVAIPATSASGNMAQGVARPAHLQGLVVSAGIAGSAVVRDSSTVVRVYRQAGPGTASTGGWTAPIDRPINSPWGPRAVICTGGVGCDSGFHRGDDFAASCGTPFYAVTAGMVTAITRGGLAGDQIVISHAGGVSTAYSHMFDSGILVSVGQTVSAGQNIGLVGSSGDSTGCHLYFEYRIGGLPVDPVPAMASHGVALRLGGR